MMMNVLVAFLLLNLHYVMVNFCFIIPSVILNKFLIYRLIFQAFLMFWGNEISNGKRINGILKVMCCIAFDWHIIMLNFKLRKKKKKYNKSKKGGGGVPKYGATYSGYCTLPLLWCNHGNRNPSLSWSQWLSTNQKEISHLLIQLPSLTKRYCWQKFGEEG